MSGAIAVGKAVGNCTGSCTPIDRGVDSGGRGTHKDEEGVTVFSPSNFKVGE